MRKTHGAGPGRPKGSGTPAEHGTLARYQQGCRCEECRAANAAYARESRRRYWARFTNRTPAEQAQADTGKSGKWEDCTRCGNRSARHIATGICMGACRSKA